MVWADQQPGYEIKDVPVKLLLKNLYQIYSGSYRKLKNISIEEARQVDLSHWLNTRLKDNTVAIPIQDRMKREEDNPHKTSPYKKISKKKSLIKPNTSESLQSPIKEISKRDSEG